MSQFDNVSVIREASVYFDGKVNSRTVVFADGSSKTLGIMLPGEYEFGTEKEELMEILSGRLDILLPNSSDWQQITDPTSFEVPKNSSFKVKVHAITDYCCSYLD